MLDLLGALLYKLATPIVVLVVRVFFRRVEVRGEDRVPSAPIVVGANHPNMLLDPLLVGVALRPRRLHFLAKAPLFKIPGVGWMFRLLGVLPVYRRQDSPGTMDQNDGMFSACVRALHQGRSIGIFPEGVSASEPWLQPIKTGAARILLEASEARPEKPMFLQPVGLNYEDREVFRSDVLVLFGDPIDPRPYLARYAEDPREAVRDLTRDLEEALRAVTLNVARVEDDRVVTRLERVYQTELMPVGEDLERRFYLSRSIVDGYEHYKVHDPLRVQAVEEKLSRYFFALEALDLAGAHLRDDAGYRPGNILLFLVRVVPPLLLAAPLALWGLLNNFLPYNLTDPLARRGDPGPEELATNKVVLGTTLFLLFYAAQALLVYSVTGFTGAAFYLLSLPPCGFVALWWVGRLKAFGKHWRTFVTFLSRSGLRQRMRRDREALLSELESLSEQYLRRRETGEGVA
jgi:1-acyl-sn-glycerol-3-phosphate acyltransferase